MLPSFAEIDVLEKPPPKLVLKPLDLAFYSTFDTFYTFLVSSSEECLGCTQTPMMDDQAAKDRSTVSSMEYIRKFDKRNAGSRERLVIEALG